MTTTTSDLATLAPADELSTGATAVDERGVTFVLPDSTRALAGVRLQQEVRIPGELLEFDYDEPTGAWTLRIEWPEVDRIEYRFEVRHSDGGTESCCDPGHPSIAPGAFGDKSVVEHPGYVRPGWLDAEAPAGERRWVTLPSRRLRAEVPCLLWSSAGTRDDAGLPLLVAHDGPEYDKLSSLLRFLDVMVDQGRLPAMRAALLQPVDRDESYSASANYARALDLEIVPRLEALAPTGGLPLLGMGASLGGLAMLHAQRRFPRTFGALYLQSSSFFHPRFDDHEGGFARFRRVTRFITDTTRTASYPDPVPVAMTCGHIEENVDNNRLLARSLGAQGYDVTFVENRDVHTWVGWRDTFDPHLVELAAKVWS